MDETRKSCSGREVNLDVSDEACCRFGFACGDRFSLFSGELGIVAGVGPINPSNDAGPLTLWYELDQHGGCITFHYPLKEGDLRPV
jgi:hypothetical protein